MTFYKYYANSDIAYLEGNENYTNIFLTNGQKLLSSYTLLRHEEKLTNFVRISRSHLVNPEYILSMNLKQPLPHVVLKSGKLIRIPKRRLKGLRFL